MGCAGPTLRRTVLEGNLGVARDGRHSTTRRGSAGTRRSLRAERKFDAIRKIARPINHKAVQIK